MSYRTDRESEKETLARKFTTPEAFRGKAPAREWWNVTNREPIYPPCSRPPARLAVLPFESGKSVLPGLEAFAHENGLL